MQNTLQLPQETIESFINDAETEVDAALALYKHVYPNWDDMQDIDGYPSVSETTGKFIMNALQEKFGKGKALLGVWFNKGFSTLKPGVPDWQVLPAPYTLQEEKNAE